MAKKKVDIPDTLNKPEVTSTVPVDDLKSIKNSELQDIKDGITNDTKKPATRVTKATKIFEEKQKQIEDDELNKNLIMSLVSSSNVELVANGLTPISDGQTQLLTMSLLGVMRKYNFTLDTYPEFTAGGAVLWIGYDKYMELQAKKKEDPTTDSEEKTENSLGDN